MFEFRPKTSFVHTDDGPAIVKRVMAQTRRNNPARLRVESLHDTLFIRFPKDTAELWTPELEVRLQPRKEGGVNAKAILGPSSMIWILFRTALIAIAALGVIGLVLCFAQWYTGEKPWGIYLAAAGLFAGLFIWFLSEEGKRRAKDEMDLLRTFMNDALDGDHLEIREKATSRSYQRRMA